MRGRGKLNLHFTEVILPNGVSVPLTASLLELHDKKANEEGEVQSSTKGSTVAKDVGIGAGLGTVAGLLLGNALKGPADRRYCRGRIRLGDGRKER